MFISFVEGSRELPRACGTRCFGDFPGQRSKEHTRLRFETMTAQEEKELEATVRSLQPDIIWVGLSTPKQERFMARYLSILDTRVMIGVGAAFLFHTGAIRDSPRVGQAGRVAMAAPADPRACPAMETVPRQ